MEGGDEINVINMSSFFDRRLSYATVDDRIVDYDEDYVYLFERCNEKYRDKVVVYYCCEYNGYSRVQVPGDELEFNEEWYSGLILPLQRRTPRTKVFKLYEEMESYAMNLWVLQEVHGLSFADASFLMSPFRRLWITDMFDFCTDDSNPFNLRAAQWELWKHIMEDRLELEEFKQKVRMEMRICGIDDDLGPLF